MISIAGSQMQLWALFWHIRVITNQPIALGGIGLARILPVILFSLFGGAVADVASRRVVLFITQSAMALVALALALLTFQGHIALWHIYLLTAIQAVAISFDSPARQSLVPNLVPAKDLSNAFSLSSIAQQTGAIIGPALTGFVIAYGGLGYTYLINAISFVAVLVALLFIGPVAQDFKRNAQSAISLPAIAEGVRFIADRPIILASMIMDFFATFFSSANTLMPIFTRDILHVGVVQYGWLSAAQSMGAVAAALFISQLPLIRRQGPVFLISVLIFGAATILFGASHIFSIAMLGLVLMGAADTVSTIIRNTIRQLQTPDYIRGRMTSINQIFFMGGPQFGEVEAGVVAQFFGAPLAIISGGIGCILATIWIMRRWPQLRTYNGDEPVLDSALAD